MKIVKICKYAEGKERTLEEYEKLCKEKGCRLPDANEAFIPDYADYKEYFPFAVKTPLGLAARYYDGDYYFRRDVSLGWRPSGRAGVLGIKPEKEETPKTDAELRTQNTQLKAKLDSIGKILEGKA